MASFKKGDEVFYITNTQRMPHVLTATVFCIRKNGRISFMLGGGIDASPEDVFLQDEAGRQGVVTRHIQLLEAYMAHCQEEINRVQVKIRLYKETFPVGLQAKK